MPRSIGIIAGIILVVGALVVFAQFLGRSTGGASADVVKYENLPAQITLPKDTYAEALGLIDSYQQAYDLATKNRLIGELEELLTAAAK